MEFYSTNKSLEEEEEEEGKNERQKKKRKSREEGPWLVEKEIALMKWNAWGTLGCSYVFNLVVGTGILALPSVLITGGWVRGDDTYTSLCFAFSVVP
jgi:hypothetical protein